MKYLLVPLLVIVVGCDGVGSERNGVGPGQFRHPERDASEAFAKGDNALLGAYGYTVYVPGLAEDAYILQAKFKIRPIEGTSDTDADNPNSFNARAVKYAEAYNRAKLRMMGCKINAPMAACSNFGPR